MAGIGAYLAGQILNVSLKQAASIVSPSTLALAISLGAPTSLSMSEVLSGSGYTPQTLTMSSVSTGGSIMVASNAVAVTYGPFSSAQSLSGVVITDTVAFSGGNQGDILYFGLLATARTVSIGDSLVVAAAALTVTLS